ncbi:hypothetical protein BN2497_2045 [Janthinobacterium sp. CG23_2]|nr:hypothetical protein BN2497_2045 [Janthinobacterium sp. CG23_2]CUU27420.1 hypothetical protein BN3177_2045 [Janthinobacterium sp. CG23_2]
MSARRRGHRHRLLCGGFVSRQCKPQNAGAPRPNPRAGLPDSLATPPGWAPMRQVGASQGRRWRAPVRRDASAAHPGPPPVLSTFHRCRDGPPAHR